MLLTPRTDWEFTILLSFIRDFSTFEQLTVLGLIMRVFQIANVLEAVLYLLSELERDGLETVADAVRRRINNL